MENKSLNINEIFEDIENWEWNKDKEKIKIMFEKYEKLKNVLKIFSVLNNVPLTMVKDNKRVMMSVGEIAREALKE
jgi:hypothetical protein